MTAGRRDRGYQMFSVFRVEASLAVGAFIQVFASTLWSWLSRFRRRAPRSPDGRPDSAGSASASHGTGTGDVAAATQLRTDGDAFKNTGVPARPTARSEAGNVEGSCAGPVSTESAAGGREKIPQCDPTAAVAEMKPTPAEPVRGQPPNGSDEPTGEGSGVDALESGPGHANSGSTCEGRPAPQGTSPAGVLAGETAGRHPPDPESSPIEEQFPAGGDASAQLRDVAEGEDGEREQHVAVPDPTAVPRSERNVPVTEDETVSGAGPVAAELPGESQAHDATDRDDTPQAQSEDGKVGEEPPATPAAAPDVTTDSRRDDVARRPAANRRTEGRRPSPYQPPAGGPPPQRRAVPSSIGQHRSRKSPAQHSSLQIEVRILFQRGGYCSVSLLPRRATGLPAELLVASEGTDLELLALQEDWYQDVAPDELADLLRKGIVWRNLDTGYEWTLSGREVFVLAQGTTHRGFVSCARLRLGRNHVVLCTATMLGPVEDVLREAGCGNWTQLREEDGVPRGWLALKDIVPQRAVLRSAGADILNVLRPLSEIDIALEGGIRLAYNTWLLGYPPAIHVYGDPQDTKRVLVDGREASVVSRDRYTAPGWDAEGDHSVWCGDSSKSYSLARCSATWTRWPAYTLDVSNGLRRAHKFEFCGPLVRPVVAHERPEFLRAVHIPAANPVLLGARPGEVFFARPRRDVRGAECIATPTFEPVWAMPAQPLHCDKLVSRVLLIEWPLTQNRDVRPPPVGGRRDLEFWCLWILDARRKGLAVQPASSEAEGLWKDYGQLARTLWRTLR